MVQGDFSALQRLGQGDRGVEDSVSFSLAHRIRIEIQAALHEGPATASRLSEIVRRPLSTVGYHIEELLSDGSIDIAKTEKVGNMDVHYYCMVKLPYYSDEDVAAMTVEQRQALAGLIAQAAMAELLASLWAGKLATDPRVMLAWNRYNLDSEGREEMADEEAESWKRREEIEAKSTNRRAGTGEEGTTYVSVAFGFERSRTSAPEPLDDDPPTEL